MSGYSSKMTKVALVHPHETFHVSAQLLVLKCDLFGDNTILITVPYNVTSHVSLRDFQEFVSALEGATLTIKNNNFRAISQLCDEFRFRDLAAELSRFQESSDFNEDAVRLSALEERMQQRDAEVESLLGRVGRLEAEETRIEESETRISLSALEEQMQQRDHEIAVLRCELSRQLDARELAEREARSEPESAHRQESETQKDVCQIRSEVENFRDTLAENARTIALLSQEVSKEAQKKAESIEALLGRVVRLEAEVSALQSAAEPIPATMAELRRISSDVRRLKIQAGMDSLIVSDVQARGIECAIVWDFPEIFSEFRGQRFSLLWRGSRDGFGASDFHKGCDGHVNTVTVILDTNGNIFGGFTPVAWESRKWNKKTGRASNTCKADPTQKSFLFTLKNPHNVPARRFALTDEGKDIAIRCNLDNGPHFNDIAVSNNCSANSQSFTNLGITYTNDTGMIGEAFFTGSRNFQVKEIEVFEITA
jgi:hypothetical protein